MESLYQEGQVKFYEACMLESIKNAVNKFVSMGILSRKVVPLRRGQQKVYFQLSEPICNDNDKITELYEQIIYYLPFSPNMNLNKMLSEIRKLTVSDIMVPEVTPIAKL